MSNLLTPDQASNPGGPESGQSKIVLNPQQFTPVEIPDQLPEPRQMVVDGRFNFSQQDQTLVPQPAAMQLVDLAQIEQNTQHIQKQLSYNNISFGPPESQQGPSPAIVSPDWIERSYYQRYGESERIRGLFRKPPEYNVEGVTQDQFSFLTNGSNINSEAEKLFSSDEFLRNFSQKVYDRYGQDLDEALIKKEQEYAVDALIYDRLLESSVVQEIPQDLVSLYGKELEDILKSSKYVFGTSKEKKAILLNYATSANSNIQDHYQFLNDVFERGFVYPRLDLVIAKSTAATVNKKSSDYRLATREERINQLNIEFGTSFTRQDLSRIVAKPVPGIAYETMNARNEYIDPKGEIPDEYIERYLRTDPEIIIAEKISAALLDTDLEKESGVFESLGKGLKHGWFRSIPFLSSLVSANEQRIINSVVEKISSKQELSPSEQILADAVGLNNFITQTGEQRLAYTAGNVLLPEAINFAIDLGTTGGVSTAAKSVAKRSLSRLGITGATKWTDRSVRSFTSAIGVATQAAASRSDDAALDVVRRLTPYNSYYFTGTTSQYVADLDSAGEGNLMQHVARAYINQMIELATEKLGTKIVESDVASKLFSSASKFTSEETKAIAMALGMSEDAIPKLKKILSSEKANDFLKRLFYSDLAQKVDGFVPEANRFQRNFIYESAASIGSAMDDFVRAGHLSYNPLIEYFEEFIAGRLQPIVESDFNIDFDNRTVYMNMTGYEDRFFTNPIQTIKEEFAMTMWAVGPITGASLIAQAPSNVASLLYGVQNKEELSNLKRLSNNIILATSNEFNSNLEQIELDIQTGVRKQSNRVQLQELYDERKKYENGDLGEFVSFESYIKSKFNDNRINSKIVTRLQEGNEIEARSLSDGIKTKYGKSQFDKIMRIYDSFKSNDQAKSFIYFIRNHNNQLASLQFELANIIENPSVPINFDAIEKRINDSILSPEEKSLLNSLVAFAKKRRGEVEKDIFIAPQKESGRAPLQSKDGKVAAWYFGDGKIRLLFDGAEYVDEAHSDMFSDFVSFVSSNKTFEQLVSIASSIDRIDNIPENKKSQLAKSIAASISESVNSIQFLSESNQHIPITQASVIDDLVEKNLLDSSDVQSVRDSIDNLIQRTIDYDTSQEQKKLVYKVLNNLTPYSNIFSIEEIISRLRSKRNTSEQEEEVQDGPVTVVIDSPFKSIKDKIKNLKIKKSSSFTEMKKNNPGIKKLDSVLKKLKNAGKFGDDTKESRNARDIIVSAITSIPEAFIDFDIELSSSHGNSFYDAIENKITIGYKGRTAEELIFNIIEEFMHSVHRNIVMKALDITPENTNFESELYNAMRLTEKQIEEIAGTNKEGVLRQAARFWKSKNFNPILYYQASSAIQSGRDVSPEDRKMVERINKEFEIISNLPTDVKLKINGGKPIDIHTFLKNWQRYEMFRNDDAGYTPQHAYYYAADFAEFFARTMADFLIGQTVKYGNMTDSFLKLAQNIKRFIIKTVVAPIFGKFVISSNPSLSKEDILEDNSIQSEFLGRTIDEKDYKDILNIFEQLTIEAGNKKPETVFGLKRDENGNIVLDTMSSALNYDDVAGMLFMQNFKNNGIVSFVFSPDSQYNKIAFNVNKELALSFASDITSSFKSFIEKNKLYDFQEDLNDKSPEDFIASISKIIYRDIDFYGSSEIAFDGKYKDILDYYAMIANLYSNNSNLYWNVSKENGKDATGINYTVGIPKSIREPGDISDFPLNDFVSYLFTQVGVVLDGRFGVMENGINVFKGHINGPDGVKLVNVYFRRGKPFLPTKSTLKNFSVSGNKTVLLSPGLNTGGIYAIIENQSIKYDFEDVSPVDFNSNGFYTTKISSTFGVRFTSAETSVTGISNFSKKNDSVFGHPLIVRVNNDLELTDFFKQKISNLLNNEKDIDEIQLDINTFVGFAALTGYSSLLLSYRGLTVFNLQTEEVQEQKKMFEKQLELLNNKKDSINPLLRKYNFIEAKGGLAADTNSKEFKEWFGGSKTVMPNGLPRVYFHATKADSIFEEFDKSFIASGLDSGGAGWYGQGFYFTHLVNHLSGMFSSGYITPVYSVYLKAENPYPFRELLVIHSMIEDGELTYETLDPDQKKIYDIGAEAAKMFYGFGAELYGSYEYNPEADPDMSIFTDNGYDSVDVGHEIVVFEPDQIKSVYNKGAFDKTSLNIFESGVNVINSDIEIKDESIEFVRSFDSGINVFHGTHAIVENFSKKFVSTGEGFQAFGWGLYFTDIFQIAKFYASSVARAKGQYSGYIYDVKLFDGKKNLLDEGSKFRNIRDKKKYHFYMIDWYRPVDKTLLGSLKKFLFRKVQKGDIVIYPNQRKYFEIDERIARFEVEKRFENVVTNSDMYQALSIMMGTSEIYQSSIHLPSYIEANSAGQKAASMILRYFGVDGVRYNALGATDGNIFNYVMFDDKDVSISRMFTYINGLAKMNLLYEYKKSGPFSHFARRIFNSQSVVILPIGNFYSKEIKDQKEYFKNRYGSSLNTNEEQSRDFDIQSWARLLRESKGEQVKPVHVLAAITKIKSLNLPDGNHIMRQVMDMWRKYYITANAGKFAIFNKKDLSSILSTNRPKKFFELHNEAMLIEKIVDDSKFRLELSKTPQRRMIARQRSQRYMANDPSFYVNLRRLARISPSIFQTIEDLRKYNEYLSASPESVNVSDFIDYVNQVYSKYIASKDPIEDALDIATIGNEEQSDDLLEQMRDYAVYAANYIAVNNYDDKDIQEYASLDVGKLSKSQLNKYIRGLKYIIRNESLNHDFHLFAMGIKAHNVMEEYLEEVDEENIKWFNKKTSRSRLHDSTISKIGNIKRFGLKEHIRFLEGTAFSYDDATLTRNFIAPLESNYNEIKRKMEDILNEINPPKRIANVASQHIIGMVGLLSQKPVVILTGEMIKRYNATEESQSDENQYRIGERADESSGIYKFVTDQINRDIADSIILSFLEIPDSLSEMTDKDLREIEKEIYASSGRSRSKIRSDKKKILEKTGYNSISELVEDILSKKESFLDAQSLAYLNKLRGTMENIKNGDYTDGISLRKVSEVYSGESFVEVGNYMPIQRYNEFYDLYDNSFLEQQPDMAGQQDSNVNSLQTKINTDININNSFIRQRRKVIMALNTNAYTAVRSRADQQLFYILNQKHRNFLEQAFKHPFWNPNGEQDRLNKQSRSLIKQHFAIVMNRGVRPSVRELRKTKWARTTSDIIDQHKIWMVSSFFKALAQQSSVLLSMQAMKGNILRRLRDVLWAAGKIYSAKINKYIRGRRGEDDVYSSFTREYMPEIHYRGIADFDLDMTRSELIRSLGSLGDMIKGTNDFRGETRLGRQLQMLPLLLNDRIAAKIAGLAIYKNLAWQNNIDVDLVNPDIYIAQKAQELANETQATDNPLYQPSTIANIRISEDKDPTELQAGGALGELWNRSNWAFKTFAMFEAKRLYKARQKILDGIVDGNMTDVKDGTYEYLISITSKMLFQYMKFVGMYPIYFGISKITGDDERDIIGYRDDFMANLTRSMLDYFSMNTLLQQLVSYAAKQQIKSYYNIDTLPEDLRFALNTGDFDVLGYIGDQIQNMDWLAREVIKLNSQDGTQPEEVSAEMMLFISMIPIMQGAFGNTSVVPGGPELLQILDIANRNIDKTRTK